VSAEQNISFNSESLFAPKPDTPLQKSTIHQLDNSIDIIIALYERMLKERDTTINELRQQLEIKNKK